MLFIVFDIEIVFLFTPGRSPSTSSARRLIEMVAFVLTVLIAYAYVLAARRPGVGLARWALRKNLPAGYC